MYEESELSYFKGGLAVGIGLGLLSGVASTIWYHRKKVLSADQVLENIKSSFLKEGDAHTGTVLEISRKKGATD